MRFSKAVVDDMAVLAPFGMVRGAMMAQFV